jgi:hypothetical protein
MPTSGASLPERFSGAGFQLKETLVVAQAAKSSATAADA